MRQRALSPTIRRRIEWALIALALLGLALMVQPFWGALFRVGFWFLFLFGIGYVATTFWPPERVTLWDAIKSLLGVVIVLALVIGVSILLVPKLL
ncbi:MAG: hypothetical protein KatS3mg115_1009 [Candidatus Poribacteria bacterium]|nr:MAG: hypothetical protein KatS3mg115_1009 [Candidatus Poribacteria bacterium]